MRLQASTREREERDLAPESARRLPSQPRISVIVPTYRRPLDLAHCLTALENQKRLPDRVILVVRTSDFETQRFLQMRASRLTLTPVYVERGGLVAALNAGLDASDGDIVALTDDDARPHINWLERIEAHFANDAAIGGIGGRDFVQCLDTVSESSRVGKIEWHGRQVGNHHVGTGPMRDVDVLKGVNMSFRFEAIRNIRFDERLRGPGAQVHNELAFCFAVSRGGWRLVYDPAVAVDHFPAERFDEDQRSAKSRAALEHSAFNQTLSLLEFLPPIRRMVFCVWAFGVGTRELPGIAQCIRGRGASRRLTPVFSGRLQAINFYLTARKRLHEPHARIAVYGKRVF